jgi:hypothetical protein
LEGACPPNNFSASSDKRALIGPIVPKGLFDTVRTSARRPNIDGAHHEVSIRYAWQAKRCHAGKATGGNPVTRVRLRELERIFRLRYGRILPDDDAGRDDLILAAHHIAQMRGEIVKHIVCWASLWAPWMAQEEAKALAEEIAAAPRKFKATTLGCRLRLTDVERTALRITTIRAVDVSADEMGARRKQRDRERKRKTRQRQRVTKSAPMSKSRPWQAWGISRATWYRHRKVRATQHETKRVRSRVASIAADGNCLTVPSVRCERLASSDAIHRPGTLSYLVSDGPLPSVNLDLSRLGL